MKSLTLSLAVSLCLALPALVTTTAAPAAVVAPVPTASGSNDEARAANNYSFVRYDVDYDVRADGSNVQLETHEILLRTSTGVEQFSQVRLGYSEKMETLEVVEAYTLAADGQRRDVAEDRIYTQESYSSASAAMYADRKVKVIVFPNLAPGTRLVYSIRRTQHVPYFPGYFGLWETFSVFTQYDDARVRLRAPESLPMHVSSRGMRGSDRPRKKGGVATWEWTFRRTDPLPAQNWGAAQWEFSPGVMASTYGDWAQMARAYQAKAGVAASVTPDIRTLADRLTEGVVDRREQADILYRWVAGNIRYVAVYLGNGGLEPNSAQSILDNHYGDCKDHVVILEALLAAKGIASTPVLIGAGGGPTLPALPVLGRFNHAITYVPEFDLYLDSTSQFARFGQLPEGDLGAPVLHTVDGRLGRTPGNDVANNASASSARFVFRDNGDVDGETTLVPGNVAEIAMRSAFTRLTTQNLARVEQSLMASSGLDGQGRLQLLGSPQDLRAPFNYRFDFKAQDVVDFSVPGGMALPDVPGAESFRDIYATTSAPTNQTPFYCTASLREETYQLQFPAHVPIIAIPRSMQFSNVAGDYVMEWSRQGQVVTAHHRLLQHALRGEGQVCQPQDYPAFRELYQQVRRGFRGQVLYGDLGGAAQASAVRPAADASPAQARTQARAPTPAAAATATTEPTVRP